MGAVRPASALTPREGLLTTITVRPPARRVRRLAATLYAYAVLRDLVLLYPVYALLFADNGLSVWQISTLFAIWSASGGGR